MQRQVDPSRARIPWDHVEASLGLWRDVLKASVASDDRDLTTRQMAMFLCIYLGDPPYSVRGLSELMGIGKPAVTRALDVLSALGFVRRKRDPNDRRSVLVHRTVRGAVYLSDFGENIERIRRDLVKSKPAKTDDI